SALAFVGGVLDPAGLSQAFEHADDRGRADAEAFRNVSGRDQLVRATCGVDRLEVILDGLAGLVGHALPRGRKEGCSSASAFYGAGSGRETASGADSGEQGVIL